MASYILSTFPPIIRCCTSGERFRMKVSVIGSGNWGTAVARIVGSNVANLDGFDKEVKMFVYEETIDGRKLSDIINETRYNDKYLPRRKLPANVIADPDLVRSAYDADFLIFVVPHQFIKSVCSSLSGKIKPTAVGLSLIKGFESVKEGGIEIVSHLVGRYLGIEVGVMMGANLAGEIADGRFCETTLGCKDPKIGNWFKRILQTDYFRVSVIDDAPTVELCGALKNVVGCAAGFVDGMKLGDNTKAAVVRLGLVEMRDFVDEFYPGSKISTYLESCGVADLIASCYGDSRNRRVSEEFVRTGRPLHQLEEELLNGQKLQGAPTARQVNKMLKAKSMENRFPLFTAVHRICSGQMKPQLLIDAIKEHPAHK